MRPALHGKSRGCCDQDQATDRAGERSAARSANWPPSDQPRAAPPAGTFAATHPGCARRPCPRATRSPVAGQIDGDDFKFEASSARSHQRHAGQAPPCHSTSADQWPLRSTHLHARSPRESWGFRSASGLSRYHIRFCVRGGQRDSHRALPPAPWRADGRTRIRRAQRGTERQCRGGYADHTAGSVCSETSVNPSCAAPARNRATWLRSRARAASLRTRASPHAAAADRRRQRVVRYSCGRVATR